MWPWIDIFYIFFKNLINMWKRWYFYLDFFKICLIWNSIRARQSKSRIILRNLLAKRGWPWKNIMKNKWKSRMKIKIRKCLWRVALWINIWLTITASMSLNSTRVLRRFYPWRIAGSWRKEWKWQNATESMER